jgi:hypothetical protein
MGEWLLSRRDRLIVARHEVPGERCGEPRPGGTVDVMVRDICCRNGVHAALETPGIPVERYVGVQSKPRSVQSSRWDGVIFRMTRGTSCLAWSLDVSRR